MKSKYLAAVGVLILFWMAFRYSVKAIIISSALNPIDRNLESIEITDEYKIYNLLINNHLTTSETELILIENQTGLGFLSNSSHLEDTLFVETEKSLWTDFKTKNSKSFILSNPFILDQPYILVDRDKAENLNRTLLIFNNINCTPFLQFSRIGFNSRSDEALVHVSSFFLGDEFLNISTFAFGKYMLLKRVDGNWIILKEWDSFIT